MVNIYLLTLFGTTVLAVLADWQVEYAGEYKKRSNIILYLLMLFLIVILGFRYLNYAYSDEWAYRTATPDQNLQLTDVLCPEGLNHLLSWLSKYVFCSESGPFANGQFYILSTSIIIVVLYVKAIWDYSEHFTFSMYLFITMGYWITSANIIRQFVATAILFYGFRYLKNGNFIKYAICVLVAFGFHTSAIIMLPFYFILRLERLSGKTFLLITVTFLMLGRVDEIGNILFADNKYSIYFGTFGDGSVSTLRILSMAIPCIIILAKKNFYMDKSRNEWCDINMLVLTLIILVFSKVNIYFNRISYYFSVSCLVMFPKIPLLGEENGKKFIAVMMTILFFIFGLYQAQIAAPYHNILFENISGVL